MVSTVFLAEDTTPSAGFTPDTRTFGEKFTAGWQAYVDLARANDQMQRLRFNSQSETAARSDVYDRRNARIEALTGVKLENPYSQRREVIVNTDNEFRTSAEKNFANWKIAAEAAAQKARGPDAMREALDLARGDIEAEAQAITRGSVARAEAASAAAQKAGVPGLARFSAELAGGIYGTARDPLQYPLFLLGGPEAGAVRTIGGRLLTRMATDAVLNAGAEAAMQAVTNDWQQKSGVGLTWGERWQQVGIAAAFGGGLGGLLQGGSEVFRLLGKANDPALTQAFERVARGEAQAGDLETVAKGLDVAVPEQDLKAFNRAIADDQATAATLSAGNAEPRAVAEAAQAIETGGPLPQPLAEPPVLAPANFRFFKASELQTDAARFQFKEGGDAQGVTDRLKGVTEWKPERAGVTIVYEEQDGRLFVADGHQRAGLARRIGAATGQDISLPGYVFRAADGYTAEDVRVIAALKNIGEGSGSALDAAKVLRTGKIEPKATGLPLNSAMVRDAAGLARLSDDAFTMAVNEVVDTRYAAIVGRLVDDPKLHAQMLDVLKTAEPKSMGEAESMVRDMLAEPTFTETQGSLFGDEDVKRMLLKEKAQVRQSTLRALKKDKALFATLLENENRIAEAGNMLDTAANSERAQQDAILIEAIDRLSRQVGPVADALNAAALAVAGGESAGKAARGFAEAVRSEIAAAGGNLGRIDPGRSAPLVDPAISGTRAIEPGSTEAQVAAEDVLRQAGGTPEPTQAQLEAQGQGNMFGEIQPPASPDIKTATRALIAAQPERTFDQLYEGGALEAAQQQLGKAGDEIAAAAGVTFKNPGVKKRPTAEAKMGRKGYLSTRQLTDLVRGGFVVDTPAQADQVAAEMARRFTVVDEGWVRNAVNYTDRKLLVQFADGTIGEVQIWERRMLEAKSAAGHKLYEEARMLPAGDARVADLEAQQTTLYGDVLAGLSEDWRASLGIGGKPGNMASSAAGETTRPLSTTSARLTDTQGRPGASTAQAPAAESTAGRSSQSTNVRGDVISTQDSAGSAKMQTGAEQTPAGTQILIPGVAEITIKDRLQADMGKPMSGGAAPPPAGGLFDEAARQQIDLMDAIAAGRDGEGKPVMTTHAELRSQADRVDHLADVVSSCKE